MTSIADRYRTVLSYVGLFAALCLSAWSFFRSEHYRNDSDTMLGQAYEIQWRSTQIREQLIRLEGYIQLAIQEQEIDPDVAPLITLANINITQLLTLSYVRRVLSTKDIQLLEELRDILDNKIKPLIATNHDYEQSAKYVEKIQNYIYQITGAAVAHSSIMNQTAQININASRNRFLFAVSLALVAIGYLIIQQRHSLIRKRDNHLRSFSSLFAHMTNSRIAGLLLFWSNKRMIHNWISKFLQLPKMPSQNFKP